MPNLPASCCTSIDPSLAGALEQILIEQSFVLQKIPYALVSGKKPGVSCTLYASGKLLVQGSKKRDFIEFFLEPKIIKKTIFTYPYQELDLEEHMGSDESGKGDFLGPLCVCAVYGDRSSLTKALNLGVKDSKTLRDKEILNKVQKLHFLPHEEIVLFPKTYNSLYEKFQNLNHLLAWAHATVIKKLAQKTGAKRILVDQFAPEGLMIRTLKSESELSLEQRVRAEDDPAVASASLFARAAFLRGMESLEKEFSISLPKGASRACIDAAISFVKQHSKESLGKIAKLHFKSSLSVFKET